MITVWLVLSGRWDALQDPGNLLKFFGSGVVAAAEITAEIAAIAFILKAFA